MFSWCDELNDAMDYKTANGETKHLIMVFSSQTRILKIQKNKHFKRLLSQYEQNL